MAARSFLLNEDLNPALDLLLEGAHFPERLDISRRRFADWLQGKLVARLASFGDFAALKPVLIGSWARGELCPRSDIDVLFLGPEPEVKPFVSRAFQAGLKLRARVPEDRSDWTVGVDPFDILAVITAKPYDGSTDADLAIQRQLALAKRNLIFKHIRLEREQRRARQDSISNYLEPNLKFGVGGLRDIDQALALPSLFKKRFEGADPYPFEVLNKIKEEFLFLRSLLHLQQGGDIMTAPEQLELAQLLKLNSSRELMTFVQSELERASFYSDWVIAYCGASARTRAREMGEISDLADVISRLKERPSLLRQFAIRRQVNSFFKPLKPPEVGRALHRALYGSVKDPYLVGLHRTRLLEGFLPDLVQIRGLVQHDHYHRFTADAHLVQTLREVQRAESHPKTLGKLGKLSRELTAQDWWTLKLTALFHDLAKGRNGDHATKGAALVRRYFDLWNYSENLRGDVEWLVQNHLLMSTAAFRQNPQSQDTWTRLFERGVEGRKLTLLALFTAIDIRATNPEAWTEWKAQLLLNLVESLRSPGARSLQAHWKVVVGRNDTVRTRELEGWLLKLDPVLLEAISPKVLVSDLEKVRDALDRDLLPKVIQATGGRVWVRFHRRQDQTGLFLSFVKRLFGFGLSVQMASIHTLEGIGVYDWFSLRTVKPARQIAKWLALPQAAETSVPPSVEFQSIELMAQDKDEWIISFRGRDQRGLLWAAAQALVEENLSLRWARVHTWGQQVDDVFGVRPFGEPDRTLERLRTKFVT